MHYQDFIGALDRFQDGLAVKGRETAKVDDLDLQVVFFLEHAGRFQTLMYHGSIGEDGHIFTFATRDSFAKRDDVVFLR